VYIFSVNSGRSLTKEVEQKYGLMRFSVSGVGESCYRIFVNNDISRDYDQFLSSELNFSLSKS